MAGGPTVVSIWGSRGGQVPAESSFLLLGRRQNYRLFLKSGSGPPTCLGTGGCEGLGNVTHHHRSATP